MFVGATSSTYNLANLRSPARTSVFSVSPSTHRRNSKPSVSPPTKALNKPVCNGGRRNSAITYLSDISPSRSKASLTSHGDDAWRLTERLSVSPAEEEEEEEEKKEEEEEEVTAVNVMLLGANGVGKSTLTNQLLTSEYLANKNASYPGG